MNLATAAAPSGAKQTEPAAIPVDNQQQGGLVQSVRDGSYPFAMDFIPPGFNPHNFTRLYLKRAIRGEGSP